MDCTPHPHIIHILHQGQKVFLSLFVRCLRTLYLLPQGSRSLGQLTTIVTPLETRTNRMSLLNSEMTIMVELKKRHDGQLWRK